MRSASIPVVTRVAVACLAVYAAAYSASSLANDRAKVQRQVQSVINDMLETCKKSPGECEKTVEKCSQKMVKTIGADVDLAVPLLMGGMREPVDADTKSGASRSKADKTNEWLSTVFQLKCKIETLNLLGPRAIPSILATARTLELDDLVSSHVGDAMAAMGPEALPYLKSAVKDDNVRVRKLAIAGLAGKEGVKILESLLESEPKEDVRKRVVNRLVSLVNTKDKDSAPNSDGLVKTLVAQLRESASQTKLDALFSLRQLYAAAAPAVPAVLVELKNSDIRVRAEAVSVLMMIGPEARPAVTKLKELLDDKDIRVRRSAATAIGFIGAGKGREQDAKADRETVALLIEHYRREKWEGQLYLGKFGAYAVPLLVDVLKEPDPRMRKMAVNELMSTLRKTNHPVPLQLLAAAGDPAQEVRSVVANALIVIGPRTVPMLIGGLQNPNPSIRYTAAASLAGMKTGARGAVGALAKALEDSDTKVQMAACSALGAIGPEAQPAVPVLVRVLRIEGNMQDSAVHSIGKIGRGAVPALLPMLREPNLNARLAAIRALAAIGPDATEAIGPIRDRLASTDVEERRAAISALGSIGERDGSTIPGLIEFMKTEPDSGVRITTAYALQEFGWQASNNRRVEFLELLKQIKAAFVSSPDVGEGSQMTKNVVHSIESLKRQAR